jgi:mRNA-degrading endonuclease RelE of RelBE toxin-antitoxin system
LITLDVHVNARNDIVSIKLIDPEAASTILVFLQELKSDPDWLDKLLTFGNNEIGEYGINAKQWQATKALTNLWRLRILDTPATTYRVIYGYHWQYQQLVVYAVIEKSKFNYDDLTTDINKRIIADWNAT